MLCCAFAYMQKTHCRLVMSVPSSVHPAVLLSLFSSVIDPWEGESSYDWYELASEAILGRGSLQQSCQQEVAVGKSAFEPQASSSSSLGRNTSLRTALSPMTLGNYLWSDAMLSVFKKERGGPLRKQKPKISVQKNELP